MQKSKIEPSSATFVSLSIGYGTPAAAATEELFFGKRSTLIWQTSLTAAVDLPVELLLPF